MLHKALLIICLFIPILPECYGESVSGKELLEKNLQRLRAGYFPVVMMRQGGNLKLMREANLDSRICVYEPTPERIARYKSDGIPIYIYVFDGDGVLHLKDFWNGARKTFYESRTVENLRRQPSLFDPSVRNALVGRVVQFARGYKDTDVLAMCVAHEASMTSFSTPLDYDFSGPALKAFRQRLSEKYPSVDRLNARWLMSFRSFDEVVPPITDAVIAREYPKYPYMDLAAWFEFREFTDDSFVDLIHQLAATVRKEAPHIPTSVTVTAMPSAYGGWDYARLLQPGKIDVLETYQFPGDKGLIRGLTAGQTVNVCSLYFSQGSRMKLRAWRNFLNGERSNFFAGRTSQIFPHRDRLGGVSEEYKPEFDLMRKFARLTADAELYDGGVRLIYSQPSVRCYWFIDNKPDGRTYPNRGSKWEREHNTYQQGLGGWQDLLGELGIHPLFESYLDLRAQKFRHGQPETVIANQYCSVSQLELDFLIQFVEEGGTLVLDESFALFDGHGNARKDRRIPIIDQPRPTLRATFGQVDIPHTADFEPAVRELGKGKVVLLNATTVRHRATGSEEAVAALHRQLRPFVTLPPFRLRAGNGSPAAVDLYFYEGEKGTCYAAMSATRPDREMAVTAEIGRSFESVSDLNGNPLAVENGSIELKLPKNRPSLVKLSGQ